jgi:hypothetical protein
MSLPRRRAILERAFEGSRMEAELMAQAYEALLPEGRLCRARRPAVPAKNRRSLFTTDEAARPDQTPLAKGA